DGQLPVGIHELHRHALCLFGAPSPQKFENDVLSADPRLQTSAKDDASLPGEREVDVTRRPPEPERRRTNSHADRTVRAVRAAVRVRTGYELTRGDEPLLWKIEMKDS